MARSRSFVALVLALPALAACSAIIGLSDYKKGECSGGGACLNDGGADADIADGGTEGGRGTEPVSWARWLMPNYPDASATVFPSYSPPGDEVTDTVTKLVWQSASETMLVTFQTASDHCKGLTPTGTWRLPKRIELVSLLDFSSAAFVDTAHFKIAAGLVWTSSELRTIDDSKVPSVTTSFWTVNFHDGSVSPSDGTSPSAVTLCVKAAP